MDEKREQVEAEVGPAAMLIASAIVGIWLFALWVGYGVGKDIGYAVFGSNG